MARNLVARQLLRLFRLVEDPAPQLGGDLQSNGFDIDMADDDGVRFGTGGDIFVGYLNATDIFVITGVGSGTADMSIAPDGFLDLDVRESDDFRVRFGTAAAGDLLYNTGSSGQLARLPIGAAGRVLQVNSGATAPEWSGGWQAYTATTTNITETGGTKVSRYSQIAKTVNGYFHFTLGGGSAVGTSPTFTLPVTASSSYPDFFPVGRGYLRDATGNIFIATVRLNGSSRTVVEIRATNAASTSAFASAVTATVPFTWTTSDVIMVEFSYEAA